MISFAVGLVLRKGERTLQFERQLDAAKVQFRYLDTNEVCTFSTAALYTDILDKKVHPVHQNGHAVRMPEHGPADHVVDTFALHLGDDQADLIDYRMKFVAHARKIGASHGSFKMCQRLVEDLVPRLEAAQRARVEALMKAGDSDQLAREKVRTPPCADTVRVWLKKYQQSGGNPYALRDLRPTRRTSKRLNPLAEHMAEQAIARHYLQLHGATAKETHRRLVTEIQTINRRQDEQIPVPSVRTILRRISQIDPYSRDFQRCGPAYARNRWRFSLAGDQSTRILERVEIDHTWLDIWVLDPRSGVPIGRPWITVALDRLSGYPLGVFVSFYGPSVATVAQVLKCAIFPKDEMLSAFPSIKVPWTAMGAAECYVLDNGLEFHATVFKRLAWDLRSDLVYNPVRQPWLKAGIERAMMEFNRMLPLRGKVYTPMKNMKPQDPAESAAIVFDDLVECVIAWAAEVFPYHPHPKNLVRPIDLWEEGRTQAPPHLFPLSLERFDISAGVSINRTIGGDGVFFNYLRFNSYELQSFRRTYGNTFKAEVRFNPNNLGQVHVLLPREDRWLAVELQRPAREYGEGISLIQHEIIRKEAGARLTRSNAEDVLQSALERVHERWGEAISRGVRIRKDSDLIRVQGLSSANVIRGKRSDSMPAETAVPIASPHTEKMLQQVVPYAAITLEESFV